MKKEIKRMGFTLAEVLITLMIIGVVAMMTIPALISKVNESEWHVAWKKEFSVISQAYKLYLVDNEDVDFGSDITSITKLSPYLKIASTNPTLPDSNKYLCGDSAGSPLSWTNAMLADGSIVYFINSGWSGCSAYSVGACAAIYIDVNGVKAPNTMGKDIYGLYLTKNSVVPMGLSWDNSWNISCIQPPDTGWGDCTSTRNYGYGCSVKYLKE
jgi:prepilin-type N-terminal cleavage/methylation domain-containing protein